MNEPFIPLSPDVSPAPGRTGFRVAIINPAEDPRPFQPLNHGVTGNSGTHPGDHKPSVTLQRDGERISAISIQCACGQLIELACVYPPVPSSAQT
jgi:hypothetical protein